MNLDYWRGQFKFAREYTEEMTGLTLSTIELVGLRIIIQEIIKETREDVRRGTSGFTIVVVFEEFFSRFLWRFYDISPGEFDKFREMFFANEKDEDGCSTSWSKPTELTKEYFRREQEKRHFI